MLDEVGCLWFRAVARGFRMESGGFYAFFFPFFPFRRLRLVVVAVQGLADSNECSPPPLINERRGGESIMHPLHFLVLKRVYCTGDSSVGKRMS